ncbi:hypothetical protein PHISCL_06058 [Aspergillus sclerotialis]|uniref:Uncharacterized protein n=1 Tax=Aspergillus sclerotialis TaxID=2070753 RepID=A0A3A2ZEL4_9EURO|nr:hypothetical protein PHISCL_06058 [Aspergillus sclerotialis]
MNGYVPSAYPTVGEGWPYQDATNDAAASASPNTGIEQYPWPSEYLTPTLTYGYGYESPTRPTDIIYSETPNTGVAKYGLPTSAEVPPEAVEPTSSSSSSSSIGVGSTSTTSVVNVPQTTAETQTSTENEVATSTSKAVASISISTSTTSGPISIPQSTTNTTTQLPQSPNHNDSDRKTKILLSTIIPVFSVLIILIAAAILFMRRRRRRRKTQSATDGGGTNTKVETQGTENGQYLPCDRQNWDIMPTGAHDIPFDGPIPGKAVMQVRQVAVDEVVTPSLPRSAPHSRAQSLHGGSSHNSLKGVDPPAQSRPGTATDGTHLPLLEKNLSTMENKETRPSITSNINTDQSYSSGNVADIHNDAVSDISDTSDGQMNADERDLRDVSPVSTISETWDEAYTMRYTSGQVAHVRVRSNRSVSRSRDTPRVGDEDGNGGGSVHGSPN